jgi:hypothetical protein
MKIKISSPEIKINVESGNKSLFVDISNESVSIEVQAFIKGEKGDDGENASQRVYNGEIYINASVIYFKEFGTTGWYAIEGYQVSEGPFPGGEGPNEDF